MVFRSPVISERGTRVLCRLVGRALAKKGTASRTNVVKIVDSFIILFD
jgi:hypothetical protein